MITSSISPASLQNPPLPYPPVSLRFHCSDLTLPYLFSLLSGPLPLSSCQPPTIRNRKLTSLTNIYKQRPRMSKLGTLRKICLVVKCRRHLAEAYTRCFHPAPFTCHLLHQVSVRSTSQPSTKNWTKVVADPVGNSSYRLRGSRNSCMQKTNGLIPSVWPKRHRGSLNI